MIELSATTDIQASPEDVWRTLTDLPSFAEWNPFIREASGRPAVGATLRVRVATGLGFRVGFRPTVLACEAAHELRWRGKWLAPWLGSGDHTFTVEPSSDGKVQFTQREIFSGLIPALVGRLLEGEVRRGFEAMNQALKARVEKGP